MKLRNTLILAACTLWGSSVAISPADATPRSVNGPRITHQSTTLSRGRLGAQVIRISEPLRRHFAAPADVGILVDRVVPNSPAAKAGLKTGDVIIAVHGAPIHDVLDIYKVLGTARAGDSVNVKVIRNKKPRTLRVVLDSNAGGMSIQQQWGGALRPGLSPEQLRGGTSFPFGGASSPSQEAIKEQIHRLEERLDRLEGRQPTRKSPAKAPKTGTSPKQFKGAAKGTTGKRS